MKPRKPPKPHQHHHPKRPRLQTSKPPQSSKPSNPPSQTNAAKPPAHRLKPTIPFLSTDYILLVGEGDFSFAYSLLRHHAFTCLVATSLDSRDVVLEKYPHAGKFLKGLENWDLRSRGENRGADEEGQEKEENNGNGEEGEEMEEVGEINENDGRNGDEADEEDGNGEEEEEEDEEKTEGVKKEVRVKFGVDAMKLTRAKILGRTKTKKKRKKDQDKDEKQGGSERGFDKIVFNFPHVGGKTKDVNRQVRYNQDLLVNFLRTSLPLLAPEGAILITLFEGLPYSLWNIRDLARHVGLRVGRSFKFEAGAYPGYRHARTGGRVRKRGEGGVGEVCDGRERRAKGDGGEEGAGGERDEGRESGEGGEEGEEGEEEEGERRGWRGEERTARTYVFEVVEDGAGNRDEEGGKRMQKGKKKKKRKRGEDSEDDEDEP